jgi:hypothetical protein
VITWQLAVRIIEKEMKIMNTREVFVEAFVHNESLNPHIIQLVRKTMLKDNEGTTRQEVVMLYLEFLGTTEPGSRVTY